MFTVPVVSAPEDSAEAATVTESVRTVSKFPPAYPSVSVADASPAFTVPTEATDNPGKAGFVVSEKLDVATPLAKAALVRVSVTWASFRVASAKDAGDEIAAAGDHSR